MKLPDAFRAFRHRDFLVLWVGAFVSFMGGQIQTVAQGAYVYDMTGDKAKLAMVTFWWSLPVMFLAPFAGVLADRLDRKLVLTCALLVSAAGSVALALGYQQGWLTLFHIYAIAFTNGIVQTVEAPTRQSVVRSVVGDLDLASAIPAQAMTFNMARIIGPSLGGVIAAKFGIGPCFWINAFSFMALISSALLIKTDLRPKGDDAGSMLPLMLEGVRYTWRNISLRVLFLMECATSIFGMFYIALMPAIAKSKLGLDLKGLGFAQGCIGIGAMSSLLILAVISNRPLRPLLTRISMTGVAVGLIVLSFISVPWLAYILFSVIGACAIMQFNSTNTLFQKMSPDRLRGRVIAMHLWALAGMTPFGTFAFGYIAEHFSLDLSLLLGGGVLLLCSGFAWSFGGLVQEKPLELGAP